MPDNKDNKNDNMDSSFDDIFKELLGKSKDEYLQENPMEHPEDETPAPSADTPSLEDILKEEKSGGEQGMTAEEFFENYKSDKPPVSIEKADGAPAPGGEAPAQKKYDTGPDDFDIKFDFDSEYKDAAAENEDPPAIRPNREKRSGCLGGLLYFAFIIGISVILACLGWVAATDVFALGKPDATVQVTVPENFTMDDVTNLLYDNGLIKYKFLFNFYSNLSSADEKIDAGTYELNKNFDYRALVNGMTESGGNFVEVSVTVPEGYTLTQIIDLLAENNICTQDQLKNSAANTDFKYYFLDSSTLGNEKRLEGYLFPDTYEFYVGDNPDRVLDKMLTNFDSKITDEYKAKAEELGYSIPDIVKIASIIEREAGSDSERPTIASVIYNRLANGDYLQLDSTVNYAIADSGAVFSTDYDSPYNTYLYAGLPAGAISNPGLASIRAALYPDDTSYYYFALSKDGTSVFFEDGDSFTAFTESADYAGR